jgi:hypothetical protein
MNEIGRNDTGGSDGRAVLDSGHHRMSQFQAEPPVPSECGGNDTICSRRSESRRYSRREMKLLPLGGDRRCMGRRGRSRPRPLPC